MRNEEDLQKAVAEYLDHHPATKGHWFHPPNGGYRHKATAGKLKDQGVKSGVPDVLIVRPFLGPNGSLWDDGEPVDVPFSGLAIELKMPKGTVRASQRQWHETLRSCGWRVEVCRSLDEVVKLVTECYG